jgi:hypothetical protein
VSNDSSLVRTTAPRRTGDRLAAFLLIALVSCLFLSGIGSHWLPMRLVVVLIALALLFLSASAGWNVTRWLPPAALMFGMLVAIVLLFMAILRVDAGVQDTVARLFLAFPVVFVVGLVVGRTPRAASTLTRTVVVWALIVGVLSIFERLLGVNAFVAFNLLPLESQMPGRSSAGAEHPLVLASAILVATPLVLTALRGIGRIAALAIMGAGIWCTDSQGPLLIFLLFVVYRLIFRNERVSVLRVLVPVTTGLGVAALVAIGFFIDFTGAIITDRDSGSALYRVVLYAAALPFLLARPLGWGIEGIPEGAFLVPTVYGNLDLSRTIDSEIVLVITEFGIVGLAMFAVVMVLPWSRATADNLHFVWAATLLAVCGIFLAIHAWIGLGSLWALLLGAALGSGSRPPRRASPSSRPHD